MLKKSILLNKMCFKIELQDRLERLDRVNKHFTCCINATQKSICRQARHGRQAIQTFHLLYQCHPVEDLQTGQKGQTSQTGQTSYTNISPVVSIPPRRTSVDRLNGLDRLDRLDKLDKHFTCCINATQKSIFRQDRWDRQARQTRQTFHLLYLCHPEERLQTGQMGQTGQTCLKSHSNISPVVSMTPRRVSVDRLDMVEKLDKHFTCCINATQQSIFRQARQARKARQTFYLSINATDQSICRQVRWNIQARQARKDRLTFYLLYQCHPVE